MSVDDPFTPLAKVRTGNAWRRTLRERDRGRVKAMLALVPLRVVPDAVVEVVMPDGLVVRVPVRTEPAAAAALRAASC